MENTSFSPLAATQLSARRVSPAKTLRPCFSDALQYAYDGAFRARESLSLAQCAAYGLHAENFAGLVRSTASLPTTPRIPIPSTLGTRSATRDKVSETAFYARAASMMDADRSKDDVNPGVGEMRTACRAKPTADLRTQRTARRKDCPYFRFNARFEGTEFTCVVAAGRVFAGARAWIR